MQLLLLLTIHFIQEPSDSTSAYMEPNSIPSEMRAIVRYDYNAREANEMTMRVGDIIRNIIKFDNGWYVLGSVKGPLSNDNAATMPLLYELRWQGDLGQQQGAFFPSNFVDELIDDDSKQVCK